MRKRKRQTFLFIWFVLQIAPFCSSTYRDAVSARFYLPNYYKEAYAVFATIPLLILLEGSILEIICRAVRSIDKAGTTGFRKTLCRIAAAAVFLLLLIYHVVIAGSWYFFFQTKAFISRETLNLWWFLLDYRYIISTFDQTQLALGGVLFVFSALLSYGLFRCAAPLSSHSRRLRNAVSLLLVLAVVFALTALPMHSLHPYFQKIYNVNASYVLSPSYSLLWSRIFFTTPERRAIAVPMDLKPRLPEEEYRAQLKGISPNKHVILLVVEALRADIFDSPALRQKIAPRISELQESGIYFSRAYAQAPETSETLITLLLGAYPLKYPTRDLRTKLNYPVARIYDIFAEVGYKTSYLGEEWQMDKAITASPNLHLHFDPQSADLSDVPKERNPNSYTDRALGNYAIPVADALKVERLKQWINRHSAEQRYTFNVLYFMTPHFPYDQRDGVPALFTPNETDASYSFLNYDPSVADVMRNRYYNTVHYVDRLIGSIVDHLKASGLHDDTILIVTGDHGQGFHEHGRIGHSRHLDEEAIRVPLLIWGADGFGASDTTAAPVGHLDIPPTILSILGLPVHPSYQGKNILDNAAAPSQITSQRPIFSSVQALTHEDAVLREHWKFVYNHWGETPRLYNLNIDPKETRNLINSEKKIARELCSCLWNFRNKQLSYYGQPSSFRKRYYPPRHDHCPSPTNQTAAQCNW